MCCSRYASASMGRSLRPPTSSRAAMSVVGEGADETEVLKEQLVATQVDPS